MLTAVIVAVLEVAPLPMVILTSWMLVMYPELENWHMGNVNIS